MVDLKPEWPKGYSRLGAAAIGLGDTERAKEAYEKGAQQEPRAALLQRMAIQAVVRLAFWRAAAGADVTENLKLALLKAAQSTLCRA